MADRGRFLLRHALNNGILGGGEACDLAGEFLSYHARYEKTETITSMPSRFIFLIPYCRPGPILGNRTHGWTERIQSH
jgi:hypothetical protein